MINNLKAYLHVWSYNERQSRAAENEQSVLLGSPGPPEHPPLSVGWKFVAAVGAISYGAMTIFYSWATIDEYGMSILMDSTFTFGRGGMLATALVLLVRLVSHREGRSLGKIHAEAWVLILAPAFVYFFGTPAARFPEDMGVVAQAFGVVCFFAVGGL
ncbi:hypothetical protein BD779DRAFT_906977 [Infundibulicybe gibba]|nr:hypothetical protein BD779DRAFT_906977 [Infundibulicybe gibba]